MHRQFQTNFARRSIAALLLFCSASSPLHAQEDAAATDEASQPVSSVSAIASQPLNEKQDLALREQLDYIESEKKIIRSLYARLEGMEEGLVRDVTELRLDQTTQDLLKRVIATAGVIVGHTDNERDVSAYVDTITSDLVILPDGAFATIESIGDRVVLPTSDLSPMERVRADQRLFRSIRSVDQILSALIEYLDYAAALGVDTKSTEAELRTRIEDAAAGRSVYLELSAIESANLSAGVAVLPENSDLPGLLAAANERVRLLAQALQRSVSMMQKLGMDSYQYRQQLLTATGAITTDVLDVNVLANLVSGWMDSISRTIVEKGPGFLFQTFLMLLIVFVAFRIGKIVEALINKGLDASKVRVSHLLRRMIVSTGRNLTVLIGILIALAQVGISLGPLLAGLGIAGFIVGFAMQDALSNFASGMLILFYRPFDVGDTVDAGGVFGKVRSMSLVNTTIMTFDNQMLIIPNNLVWQSVIKNVTAQRTRRVDLTFGISYADDVEKAEQVFREVVDEHEKCLKEPEPLIHLHELADSSVNFIVRPWVKTDDYWDVYWDLMKIIKLRLDKEGISIPFPQRDVHLYDTRPEQPAGQDRE